MLGAFAATHSHRGVHACPDTSAGAPHKPAYFLQMWARFVTDTEHARRCVPISPMTGRQLPLAFAATVVLAVTLQKPHVLEQCNCMKLKSLLSDLQ